MEQPMVMGILNITPDSFYSGSRLSRQSEMLHQAGMMIQSGASILDVGGYSSRPDAKDISVEEEISRVIPAIEAISSNFPECIISVDTFRSDVAEKAVLAGASMINDISGGQLDDQMFQTVSRLRVPYILMHMKGTPQTMKSMSQYDNLFKEITVYFIMKVKELQNLGIPDIILDVGLGFAKKIGQNYEILKNLSYFNMFGLPLLVGVSRKSMIYKTLNTTPDLAMNGTTVLNTIALLNKASILRVHDVREAIETITLLKKGKFDILN